MKKYCFLSAMLSLFFNYHFLYSKPLLFPNEQTRDEDALKFFRLALGNYASLAGIRMWHSVNNYTLMLDHKVPINFCNDWGAPLYNIDGGGVITHTEPVSLSILTLHKDASIINFRFNLDGEFRREGKEKISFERNRHVALAECTRVIGRLFAEGIQLSGNRESGDFSNWKDNKEKYLEEMISFAAGSLHRDFHAIDPSLRNLAETGLADRASDKKEQRPYRSRW